MSGGFAAAGEVVAGGLPAAAEAAVDPSAILLEPGIAGRDLVVCISLEAYLQRIPAT